MSYTKFHTAWQATDELTGESLNHIETQWAAAKADADLHSHDARYYTKASADATFFSTSFYTGFDCDLLDGNHVADLLASVMPLGAIMIWSGTDANVPSGWHICDGGTYGGKASPDLRDRFVIGAGYAWDIYTVGTIGGPATWNGTMTPTGTVAIGNHTLTTAELPEHGHTFTEYYNPLALYSTNGSVTLGSLSSSPASIGEQNSGGGAHGHTGSSASIAAIDPRPLHHSLYYIMKYA